MAEIANDGDVSQQVVVVVSCGARSKWCLVVVCVELLAVVGSLVLTLSSAILWLV